MNTVKGSALARCIVLLCMMLLCMLPSALGETRVSKSFVAQILLDGPLPATAETFTLRLSAKDNDTPMPGGRSGGHSELSITGANTGVFAPIDYDRVGVYQYFLEQIAGNNADCTYDSKKYDVSVTVYNAVNGGFGVEIALREHGQSAKVDTARFQNVYKAKPKPTTPPGKLTKTGDDGMIYYYLVGCVLLLITAGAILCRLSRRDNNDER